ncbi:MAG: YkvA family protein [Cytophagaceae bacterium]
MSTIEAGIEKLKGKAQKIFKKSLRFEKFKELFVHYARNPEKLNAIITEHYNKATNESGQKTIADAWDKIGTLVRLTAASMKGEYNELPTYKLLILAGALVYMISPYDLVPDNTPVFGAIDDLAVLAWFIKTANDEVVKFQEWESSNKMISEPA